MPAPGPDDRTLLVEQLAQLAWLFDHRAWDRLDEVLAPDVVAYGCVGLEAVLRDSLRRHLGGCGPSQHLLGNHHVEVAGDEATTRTYARVFHQGAGERSASSYECFGEYHDRWARTGAGWRIVERRFDVTISLGDFDVLQPG
jgi:hypothetical protein